MARVSEVPPANLEVVAGTRLVALFDVLGFGSLIGATGSLEVGRRYAGALSGAEDRGWSDILPPFLSQDKSLLDLADVTVFSDTIIIRTTARADDGHHIVRFLYACWRLFQLLSFHSLPIRGAISFDAMIETLNGRVVVSEALVEASRLEHDQEWMGVFVTERAQRVMSEAFQLVGGMPARFFERVIVSYQVPRKGDRAETAYCLNWLPNLNVQIGIESFLRSEIGLIEPKLANTIAFARWIESQGRNAWFKDIEVLSFGKDSPPYGTEPAVRD